MKALARSARLAGLEALCLSENVIGPAGAQALAESPHLGRLASLAAWAAAIGNAVARALGTRIRDLPLTRERIMATLLAEK